jgi:uncharacterized protein (DUF2267 family)
MEYEKFVEVGGQASGGLGAEMAERATQATLQALAERLPRDELHLWIHAGTEPERFDLDEFLDRVAKREGTDTNHR